MEISDWTAMAGEPVTLRSSSHRSSGQIPSGHDAQRWCEQVMGHPMRALHFERWSTADPSVRVVQKERKSCSSMPTKTVHR